MLSLTLQIYAEGKWQDALLLIFDTPQQGFDSRCSFGYDQRYLVDHLDDLATPFATAVSAGLPLQWEGCRTQGAPAFLHDIAPAGAAKRFLMAHIGQEKPDGISADLFLLMRSTPAPIGHIRIKEWVAALDSRPPMGFARQEVIQRDNRFLEYAYEQGAAIGGATGAGGEAPKLLLTENQHGLLFPDAVLDDEQVRQHWFVKFARNKGTQIDQDILRSEYHYYKALQVLGINTVAVQGLALEEASKPSLWMQRFDRRVGRDGIERYAVESIYSVSQLLALPDILSASGLPAVTMNHPAIALKNLPQRLQAWGLK